MGWGDHEIPMGHLGILTTVKGNLKKLKMRQRELETMRAKLIS